MMAYRERSCDHLLPRGIPTMPEPTRLILLRPVMKTLMDCAEEYEASSLDGEFTSAAEFITWLDAEVRGGGSPVSLRNGTELR